nr:PKD domain-containing protein [Pyxidicoccus fallax]
MSRASRSTEAFLGLPVSALGTEYVVAASASSRVSRGTQLAVVGTESGTRVTFTPRQGSPSTISLNPGEVFQYAGTSAGGADLTGAVITSDKPVAVLSGSRCSGAPDAKTGTCGLQVEQLPPTKAWGRYFLAMPMAGSRGGDTFRVVASTNGTRVRINAKEVSLNRGQAWQGSLQSEVVIHASQPVLVTQYAHGSPAMMLVPPVAQYLNEYTVTALPTPSGKSYLNLIVRGNTWHQVEVDGRPIPLLKLRYLTWNYYGAQLEVAPGTHRVTSPLPLGVSVHGVGTELSYAYPGGMSQVPVAAVHSLKLTPRYNIGHAGAEVCVSAKVADVNGQPVPDIDVGFTALRWPVQAVTLSTGADGLAAWCQTRTSQSIDLLKATVNEQVEYGFVAWRASQSPPVVDAGSDASGWVGTELTLNGSASDPDGTPLTYQWTVTPGEDVPPGVTCTFGSPEALTTTFLCDQAGTYTVTLTATDGATAPVSDSLQVTQAFASDVTLCNLPRYTRDTERELCGFTTHFGDDSGIVEAWFTVDGGEPLHVEPDLNAGFVRLPYTFAEGEHVVTLSARNANGRVTTKQQMMRVDLTPPGVSVLSPQEQAVLESPLVDVTTFVQDASPVTVTTQFVQSSTVEAGTGTVTHRVDLVNRDWNVVLVQARDAAGNFTEVLVPVYVSW